MSDEDAFDLDVYLSDHRPQLLKVEVWDVVGATCETLSCRRIPMATWARCGNPLRLSTGVTGVCSCSLSWLSSRDRASALSDHEQEASGLNSRPFLIGALLSALDGDGMVLRNVYSVLTERMDFQWQGRLGIRQRVGDRHPTFTQDPVDRMSAAIREACEFGEDSGAHLSRSERDARQRWMLDLIDSMLDTRLKDSNGTDMTRFRSYG